MGPPHQPPKRRRQGERLDRSRSSRESTSTLTRASPPSTWKTPVTRTVHHNTVQTNKKRRKPHSSDSDDSDDNSDKDEDSEEEKEDDSISHSSVVGNQRVLNTRRSHQTYHYQANTHARNNEITTMETQPGVNRGSSSPSNNTPNAIWNNIDNQMQEVKVEKTAVHDYVSNYLFPKLKFLRGPGVNLEYSTMTKSICGLVMAGCHQEHSTEGILWWSTAKKQTVNEIKRLRNDASKNLKISFLGK